MAYLKSSAKGHKCCLCALLGGHEGCPWGGTLRATVAPLGGFGEAWGGLECRLDKEGLSVTTGHSAVNAGVTIKETDSPGASVALGATMSCFLFLWRVLFLWRDPGGFQNLNNITKWASHNGFAIELH